MKYERDDGILSWVLKRNVFTGQKIERKEGFF